MNTLHHSGRSSKYYIGTCSSEPSKTIGIITRTFEDKFRPYDGMLHVSCAAET